MSVKKLNREEFEKARKEEGLILLDFYADWCGPCRMVAPVLEEVSQLREDVLVGKINVDDEEALAREFGIVSIPTLIVLKNGKIQKQVAGVRTREQILELLEG
ncbi:MAG: thioredoxin [Clostridia bacterium]|nr:thioredoxin [Clostridia bacterium]